MQTALRALACIWIALVSLPAVAQDHPNPTVQSIVDWHRHWDLVTIWSAKDEQTLEY